MSACRDRKGFWSFTAKARTIVGNVKRKRKLLAAQPAFLLDPSIAPSSTPSPVTPCFPFFSSQCTSHFTSHTRSCFHPQRSAYSAPHTVNNSPIRIHKAPRSAPVSPQHILHMHLEKEDSHRQPSPHLHANPSSPSAPSMASCHHRGKHSPYDMLWAVILLALLCTFLCVGKEVAFVIATAAHLCLQVMGFGLFYPDDSVEKENIVGPSEHFGPLNCSTTIPPRSRGVAVWRSIQWNRRSKSWTPLDNSVEGEMQPASQAGKVVGSTALSKCGGLAASKPVTNSWVGRGDFSAGMKLQLVLLFTLCGLFYGRSLAICIAVCCIWTCSKMERPFSEGLYRVYN